VIKAITTTWGSSVVVQTRRIVLDEVRLCVCVLGSGSSRSSSSSSDRSSKSSSGDNLRPLLL